MKKILLVTIIGLFITACNNDSEDQFIGSWGRNASKPDFIFSKSGESIQMISNQLTDYKKGKFIPKKFICNYKNKVMICVSDKLSQTYTVNNSMLIDQKGTLYPHLN